MLALTTLLAFLITRIASLTCKPLCTQCDYSQKCLRCEKYAFMLGTGPDNVCFACELPCLTCSDTPSNCTSCLEDLSLTGNKCIECTLPNCKVCLNLTVCSECREGYNLTSDYSCIKCENYRICESSECFFDECKRCLRSDSAACIQCHQGYYLQNNSSLCLSINGEQSERCQIFSQAQKCIKCKEGYSLYNSTCQSCPSSCAQCSRSVNSTFAHNCHLCFQQYYLNLNNSCSPCEGNCKKCKDNEICVEPKSGYTISSNKTVEKCPKKCTRCERKGDQLQCNECEEGYSLLPNEENVKYCATCSTGCQICDFTSGAGACVKCSMNFLMQGLICVPCSSQCYGCSETVENCTACSRIFQLSQTASCVIQRCPLGCKNCFQKQCISCYPGHAMTQDHQCVQCLPNCTGTCDPHDITRCFDCGIGFYLYNNLCMKCKDPKCLYCSQNRCFFQQLTSTSYYYLFSMCSSKCLTCYEGTCLECRDSYILDQGKCKISDSYLAVDTDQICKQGFYLEQDYCEPCPQGYFQCELSKNSSYQFVALSCYTYGWNINVKSQQCQACSESCFTCLSEKPHNCRSCAQGYVLQDTQNKPSYLIELMVGACIPCRTGCRTCQKQHTLCDTCLQGYTQYGYSCISHNQTYLTLVYVTSFDIFLEESRSNLVQKAICNKLFWRKLCGFIITDLQSGSTVLNGAISASSSQQAQSFAWRVRKILENNSTFLGKQLVSYEIRAFENGTERLKLENKGLNRPAQTDDKLNRQLTVLIIVLCLSVALILYAVIQAFMNEAEYNRNLIKIDDTASNREIQEVSSNQKNQAKINSPYMVREQNFEALVVGDQTGKQLKGKVFY